MANEEQGHARKITDYVNSRGVSVTALGSIAVRKILREFVILFEENIATSLLFCKNRVPVIILDVIFKFLFKIVRSFDLNHGLNVDECIIT